MKEIKEQLKIAEQIAREAHRGQRRTIGRKEDYIEHPKRVASHFSTEESQIVAWLHDVLEDSNLTSGDFEEKQEESEFGKGLTYCLGLFLCHSERTYGNDICDKPDIWFNASSDHLYELEIPDFLPEDLKKRLIILRDKSLHWGHGFDKEDIASKENKTWAINEAKELLRLIDDFFKINTIRGSWE
jgi:hypothetical protein